MDVRTLAQEHYHEQGGNFYAVRRNPEKPEKKDFTVFCSRDYLNGADGADYGC